MRWRWTAALLALALLVGACSSDDKTDKADDAAEDAADGSDEKLDSTTTTLPPIEEIASRLGDERIEGLRASYDEYKQDHPEVDGVTYTGKVEDTDAYIAVVDREGKVEAYLCDGKETAIWYLGDNVDGTIQAESKGSDTLSGTVAGDTFIGVVTIDGTEHAFEATISEAPAGLYEAQAADDDALVRAGWVILPDGSERGAKLSGSTVTAVQSPSTAQDLNSDGLDDAAVPPSGGTTTLKSGGMTCTQAQAAYAYYLLKFEASANGSTSETIYRTTANFFVAYMNNQGCPNSPSTTFL